MKRILNKIVQKTLFRVFDTYVETKFIPTLSARMFENIDFHQRQLALASSAKFVAENMKSARALNARYEVLGAALDRVKLPGLCLEFGVASGESINFIASRSQEIVHGFDSFQGLPEDWRPWVRSAAFAKPIGWLPPVAKNVQLHVGWFEESLPAFLSVQSGDVAFLHIDCDLYSSTKTVFSALAQRIRPGTVIVFDEYLSYIGWEDHEHAAFMEFAEGRDFEYMFYNGVGSPAQVAVMMK
jgi:hypothetical protein